MGWAIPSVTFLGTRNQIWVERLHAGRIRYVCFLLLSSLLRWPPAFFVRLLTGHGRAAFAVPRGILRGLFDRGLKGRAHRALPRRIRRRSLP